MASNRANLDQSPNSFPLALLSMILLVLSVLGGYYLFSLKSISPDISILPTPSPQDAITPFPTLLPTLTSVSPTITPKPTLTIRPLPTSKITKIISPSATPTSTIVTLNSEDEKFSVNYQSSRKLYSEVESGGHRYTLYSPEGNITIHAGSAWSWSHPDRQFTSNTRVSGQDTFVYEVSNQTLIDFQKSSFFYTIQCVHFGSSQIKAECQQFLRDFKLL